MNHAIILAKIAPCPACEGRGEHPFTDPYTREEVGRLCMLCGSYGNLDGGFFEWTGIRTAALLSIRWRKAQAEIDFTSDQQPRK